MEGRRRRGRDICKTRKRFKDYRGRKVVGKGAEERRMEVLREAAQGYSAEEVTISFDSQETKVISRRYQLKITR